MLQTPPKKGVLSRIRSGASSLFGRSKGPSDASKKEGIENNVLYQKEKMEYEKAIMAKKVTNQESVPKEVLSYEQEYDSMILSY